MSFDSKLRRALSISCTYSFASPALHWGDIDKRLQMPQTPSPEPFHQSPLEAARHRRRPYRARQTLQSHDARGQTVCRTVLGYYDVPSQLGLHRTYSSHSIWLPVVSGTPTPNTVGLDLSVLGSRLQNSGPPTPVQGRRASEASPSRQHISSVALPS